MARSRPFSQNERDAIAEARQQYPRLGQRTLAKKLFAEFNDINSPGRKLASRSVQSIYGAIRRHDNEKSVEQAYNPPTAAAV